MGSLPAGQIGVALHKRTGSVVTLPPQNHYLGSAHADAEVLTVPTGAEDQPYVNWRGRFHIVRLLEGDVARVTVDGEQRLLGRGLHYFDTEDFSFDSVEKAARARARSVWRPAPSHIAPCCARVCVW